MPKIDNIKYYIFNIKDFYNNKSSYLNEILNQVLQSIKANNAGLSIDIATDIEDENILEYIKSYDGNINNCIIFRCGFEDPAKYNVKVAHIIAYYLHDIMISRQTQYTIEPIFDYIEDLYIDKIDEYNVMYMVFSPIGY